ncbi:MAG: shikimate kinase [Bdellovibrionota bacterium]|mgnify:CR=1 FL=1
MLRAGIAKQNRTNIYLVGFMGVGKSTVGPLLAQKLGQAYFDSDREVARHMNMSVSKIFKKGGEKKFRALESKAIRDLSKKKGAVISLGGGALLRKKNQKIIRSTGRIIFLVAPLATLRGRILRKKALRPLIATPVTFQKLRTLFETRKPGYEIADFKVSTWRRRATHVASEIARGLR